MVPDPTFKKMSCEYNEGRENAYHRDDAVV